MKGGNNMDDKNIIELYFARNEAAIGKTAEKYSALCRTLVYNILGNDSDTDECVNDTYIKVWNSIPPAKPDSLKAYVARIARNLSFDMLRKRNAKKRADSQGAIALDELAECVSGSDSPDTELFRKALSEDIDRFLDTLGEENCDIFVLRYWYAYSVKEIAERFRRSETNVSVILSRSRKKLKKYLNERGYDL